MDGWMDGRDVSPWPCPWGQLTTDLTLALALLVKALALLVLALALAIGGLTLHVRTSRSCSKRTWMNYQYWVLYSIQYFGTNNQSQHKPDFDQDVLPLGKVYELEQFALLRPLFQRILCVPASSAPVERIFFQSGLRVSMRPNPSRMSDSMLKMLMFLKCNKL